MADASSSIRFGAPAGVAQAVLAGAARIRRTPASFHVPSKSRACPAPSPEVGRTRLMGGSRQRNTGRRAIVVAGAPGRMQAGRTLAGPDPRVLLDGREARAWLAGPHG